MRRLEQFMLKITTGPRGRKDLPRIRINDEFSYELENTEGSAESGGQLTGSYSPHKMIHSFVLEGPESGYWDIERSEIIMRVREREPYTVRLGPVTLDVGSDLNLMYESPEETFDV
jgi:hypothetical protein